MERRNAEPGLIDSMTVDLGGPKTSALFDDLGRTVPWEKLARPVRTLYKNNDKGGAPAWPALTMLRCVMLAKWFNLSDPQLEENLKDRLSFRRFAGLSLTDKTPDETTFVVFRRRLREARMERTLFDAVARHLAERGLPVKVRVEPDSAPTLALMLPAPMNPPPDLKVNFGRTCLGRCR